MRRMSGSFSPTYTSYPCRPGLMGSTFHLANELGNEDRNRSTTDGRMMFDIALEPMETDFGLVESDSLSIIFSWFNRVEQG